MESAEEYYQNKFLPFKITVVSKDTVIELMESYAKEISTNAICDYLMDKSDKAHINTVEDWVNDWYKEQINQ